MGVHAHFYVKHKALANLNSYVHFPVEIHLQLFTAVIITTVFCTGATAPIVARVRGHAQLPPLPLCFLRLCICSFHVTLAFMYISMYSNIY